MNLTWNPPQVRSQTAQISWGVDYAAEVHEGVTYVGGFSSQGRPFVTVTLAQVDIAESIASGYAESEDIATAFSDAIVNFGDQVKEVIDNHDWGDEGRSSKVYRNAPTWKTITDSGALRDSQRIDFS